MTRCRGVTTLALQLTMLPRVDEGGRGERREERALVERAQRGDRAAMGELCKIHGPALYRSVLLPRLGNAAAASDALAETYARLIEKVHLFHWHPAGIYPWLRTMATHIAIDFLRAQRRWSVISPEDLERDLVDGNATDMEAELLAHHDLREARTRVQSGLGKIHPRYRRAIELRVLEDLPRDEVAAILEVSPSTFDVLLHRALKALRAALVAESDGAHAEKEAKR